ncbi:MAG: SDR family NAD(P)-dependent oxidoreductase [Planctomycetota bacterium]|nr:MAG: SDR family NAD(P)-dependent oxidoreductase [Planctomycetota bacterium]
MKKAIVVGASSGIGRALSCKLAAEGYALGLMARRKPLLDELQAELGPEARVRPTDVAATDAAMTDLRALIQEMDGVELIVICAGVGHLNPELDWGQERETIDVNVTGFCALANVAMHHFGQRGSGHLVNISSISALRGGRHAPAYNASKAFESSYMEALRGRNAHQQADVCVTDIQPGFVDTPMAKSPDKFWVATPEEAARQIYRAIRARRSHAYVTRRWRLIAWLLKCLPNALYDRM